ncbi:DegT/DnrJ/EryC1/StrS family aminotransferase [Synergistaceae bacterium OttesenSCG-928-D05]|nr:DegT/DnrJ/EryC1/StrS family aminotransferase [Synergistaceae bacterium OttesenSCG-928-D05]
MPGADIFGVEELQAVKDVIERRMVHRYGSHHLRGGHYKTEEFEQAAMALTGSKHALGVTNGTAALIVALKGLGIKAGDEVITSPFSFIATVESIVACNAVPVLGDIDEALGLDPDSVEKLINERTKAIMPVHMFGVAANMDRFVEIGKKYNIPIVEDACEVVGGTYKGRYLGSIGKAGTWSFDPNKMLTVGEGGIILTDDEDLYNKMDYYHDHGHMHRKDVDRGAEGKSGLGVNYRLNELQGALGVVAMKKVPVVLADIRATKKKILDALKDTGLKPRPMHDPEGDTATHLIFIMPTAEAAKKFQAAAKEAGMGCAIIAENTWHFAKHWDALQEMGGKDFLGAKTPSYMPDTMRQADEMLKRAVMFGLDVNMPSETVEKIITAAKAGAKAAL